VHELMQQVRESGGIEYSVQRMNQYKDEALNLLQSLSAGPAQVSLKSLVTFTTERSR
jgi:octaprenyl-diphosphate synthase